MIIANGHIQVIHKVGGGFDDRGNAIPVSEATGNIIPCNIRTTSKRRDNADIIGNAYSYGSHEVLIDMRNDFEATEVMLQHRGKAPVRCRVQSIVELECVDAIRLICEEYANKENQQ